MKHITLISIITFVILITIAGNISAQNARGYYYAGEKQHWWTDDSTSINIIVADTTKLFSIAYSLESFFNKADDEVLYDNEDDNIIISSTNLPEVDFDSLLRSVCLTPNDIAFWTYSKLLDGVDSDYIWLRNEIFIQFTDTSYFYKNVMPILDKYRVRTYYYEGDNEYRLVCDDERLMMSLANSLYGQEGVIYSTPDFYGTLRYATEDQYYGQQWGLHNTGANGGMEHIDIKAEEAWSYINRYLSNTKKDVKVAVIDDGVEPHVDLYKEHGHCMLLSGYTANGFGTGRPLADGDHGECCAGIIAAVHNNIGIAGVATDCYIVPIRISKKKKRSGEENPFCSSYIARAIKKSWQDFGVDILNISWAFVESDKITSALNTAFSHGRNGKGCAVFAATGNRGYPYVAYPACLLNVVAVGAIDRCGYRSSKSSMESCEHWEKGGGSSYGDGLSIVAPGTSVRTIDRMGPNGYEIGDYHSFNGTSAACPHAAGVAALMLSANPNLTSIEIDAIIEKSANKIRTDRYPYNVNKQNGFWNNDLGYGLVNAEEAVRQAVCGNADFYIRDYESDRGIQPSGITYLGISPDIWVTNLDGTPVTNIVGGNQYNVQVRIFNRGSTGTNANARVKLNWAKVSSNMNWNRSWNGGVEPPCLMQRGGYIGEQSITGRIGQGSCITVTFLWTAPLYQSSLPHCPRQAFYSNWQCAFLARVEEGREIIGEDETDYNIREFVSRNNNVAMKTMNVIQENRYLDVVAVDMSRDRGDGIVRVAYSSTSNANGTHISDVANVYLQFDSSMLAAWPQATRQMTGCRQVNDSVFVITDTTATFDGFLLDTAETYFISSYVRYRIPQADSTEHRFSLNFCIVDGDSVFADGDIDYTVMYDEAAYFNVTAYEDMTVMAGETFELSAEADAADATFEWYNMQDVLIGTGDHISLSTITTQQYYVRGYSPSDNTVGYDTVMVTVKHGIITKITPNPAKNQVLVKYTLADDVTNPTISLRNSYGMEVYSASVGTHPAQCHVNLRTLPTGNYTVTLEDNGVVLDSKTLVVQ